jgi:hypothetical protein
VVDDTSGSPGAHTAGPGALRAEGEAVLGDVEHLAAVTAGNQQRGPVRPLDELEAFECVPRVDVEGWIALPAGEDPAELAEYADPPRAAGLREIAKVQKRYLDLPGISPCAEYRVPFPGGSNRPLVIGKY